MAWFPSQGILPAASAGFQVHGAAVPQALVQMIRQNQYANAPAIQEAVQAITTILEKRRQDEIANHLLAAEAPRATAVNPAQAGTGTPDTALTQEMVARNQQLGYPTEQFGSPVERMAIKSVLDQKAAQNYKTVWDHIKDQASLANTRANTTKALVESGVVPGLTKPLTPAEDRARFNESPEMKDFEEQNRIYEGAAGGLNALVQTHGLTIPEVRAIDTETPGGKGGVKFVASKDLFLDSTKGTLKPAGDKGKDMINAAGEDATDEKGDAVVAGRELTEEEAVNLINKFGKDAGIKAVGKTGSKSFDMPLPDYYAMINRAKSLPPKPVRPTMPVGPPRPGAGGQISAATAAQFIQQAGGDLDRARAMARAAGWVF